MNKLNLEKMLESKLITLDEYFEKMNIIECIESAN